MNAAHFHLVMNHLPIIIPMIGLLVMLGGLILKSEVIKRTAYAIFIMGAIATVPAFASGEGAEEVLEKMQDVSHKLIHEHEEQAETFALLSYALGVIAIVGLWSNWKKKSFTSMISYLTVVMSLVVLFFAKQTGTSGGEIRHSEIRTEKSGNPSEKKVEKEVDDD
ncbi:MAG: hypothetical protein MUC49_08035 [Raineya sp.]|jgi:uncharacterized membrane protein|nr:hypothetical protein [Raineya sp.]